MAIHSKLAVVKLGTAATPTVVTDISTYCNMAKNPRSMDKSKVTTFGATAHQWLAGFMNGEFEIGGPWTRALDNHMAALFAAFQAGTVTSVNYEYGPEGTDTGDVKYSGALILDDYSGPEAKVEDAEEWTAKFTVTGTVTVGTY